MNLRNAPAAVAFGLVFCVACGHVSQQAAGAGANNTAGTSNAAGTSNIGGTSSAGSDNGAGTSNSDASGHGGSAAAGAAAGGACPNIPPPMEHRAVAQACPAARGSVGPLDTTTCTNRSGITCTRDQDCTAGNNGRCFQNGDRCQTVCSYDQCLTDADCAAGPCICRDGETALAPNDCLPLSNCRTDADCGCNYCSPATVSDDVNCVAGPLAYMCHTANDECTDASACGANTDCAFRPEAARWECRMCILPPHP